MDNTYYSLSVPSSRTSSLGPSARVRRVRISEEEDEEGIDLSAPVYSVQLEGGHPWGIRLQGGYEFAQHIRIAQVNPNSSPYKQGIRVGDIVTSINGICTETLEHRDALHQLHTKNKLCLELKREYRPPKKFHAQGGEKPTGVKILQTLKDFSNAGIDENQRHPNMMTKGYTELTNPDGYVSDDRLSSGRSCDFSADRSRSSSIHSVERRDDGLVAEEGSRREVGSLGKSDASVPWAQSGSRQRKYQPVKFDLTNSSRPAATGSNAKVIALTQTGLPGSTTGAPGVMTSAGAISRTATTGESQVVASLFPSRYEPFYRKASDPGLTSSQSGRPLVHPDNSSSEKTNFYDKEQYQHHKRSKLIFAASAPDPDAQEVQSDTGGVRSPPPTFKKISDFEKHYGTLLPSSVPTSPSRQRLIHRPTTDFLSVKADKTAPTTTVRPSVRPSVRSNRSTPINSTSNSQKSKGLEMFFNQRNKHASEDEDGLRDGLGNGLKDSSCQPQSDEFAKLDHTEIEKKIFPPDQKKVLKFSHIESLKNPEPVKEPEVLKSSARIRLLDSEESDAESLHSVKKSARTIAVKSVGKSSERSQSLDYGHSLTDSECGHHGRTRTPVTTSQDFLKSLERYRKKNKENFQPSENTAGSNLKEIKICSRKSDSKPSLVVSPLTRHETVKPLQVSTKTKKRELPDNKHDEEVVDMKQSDWYKQVFRALHILESDEDQLYSSFDESEQLIPPRPTKCKTKVTSDTEVDYVSRRKDVIPSGSDYADSSTQSSLTRDTRASRAPRTAGFKISTNPTPAQRLPDQDACLSDSALSPNSTIHNSFRRIQLNIQGDKKVVGSGKDAYSGRSAKLPAQPWRSEEDEKMCHDAYWLKLAGLDDKEPVRSTMIIHPDGYKSDSEAMLETHRRKETKDSPQRDPAFKRNVQTRPIGKATALYDFTAKYNNELSFHENDVITLVHKIDKNWYQAELRGSTGLVPANYLQMLSDSDARQHSVKPNFDSASQGSMRTTRLTNEQQDDTSQLKGDTWDSNWYEGHLGSCREIYPKRPPTTEPRVDSKRDVAAHRDSSSSYLSGFESSRSTTPLSSILSTNETSYDTDADLDKLIYDALIAIEDAAQTVGQKRNKLAHLPTNPARPPQQNLPVSSSQPARSQKEASERSNISHQINDARLKSASAGVKPRSDVPAQGVRTKPSTLKPPRSPTSPLHDRYPQTRREQDIDDVMKDDNVWTQGGVAKGHSRQINTTGQERLAKDSRSGSKKRSAFDGASYELDTGTIAATRTGPNPAKPYSVKFEEPWYQVLYNYTPEHEDELELRQGDLVYLLERCDDGWCVGHSDRLKKLGTFPGNYVKQLR